MANVGASFLGPEVKRLEGVQGIRYVYDPLGPKYLEHCGSCYFLLEMIHQKDASQQLSG